MVEWIRVGSKKKCLSNEPAERQSNQDAINLTLNLIEIVIALSGVFSF